MEIIKNLVEIFERLIYETLALFLPGSVFLIELLFFYKQFEGIKICINHPILFVFTSYILGYFLQGISALINKIISKIEGKLFKSTKTNMRIKEVHEKDLKNLVLLMVNVVRNLLNHYGDNSKNINEREAWNFAFSWPTVNKERYYQFRAMSDFCRSMQFNSLIGILLVIQNWHSTQYHWYLLIGLILAILAFRERENRYEWICRNMISASFLAQINYELKKTSKN